MVSWAWPRKSYEARVLVVPLDETSRAALPEGLEEGLTVEQADMVVLLAHDLGVVDDSAVTEICDEARAEGRLIAAVIVKADLNWHGEAARRSAVVIREAVDSVVVLRDIKLANAFVDVLRGGDRESAADAR
jgi:molybdopterin-guanine dinucleotide biosynthesis protein A